MRFASVGLLALFWQLGIAVEAGAIDIELVTVGDPGNIPDPSTGFGGVAELFQIGRFEVANSEYVAFLNAVDPSASNPNGIFNPDMTLDPNGGIQIDFDAPQGSRYAPKAGFENKPVNFVSWKDAARFVNWLENGQPADGTGTESGTYNDFGGSVVRRNADALWALPTRDEWYKAAYYDPVSPGADDIISPNYWAQPTQSDSITCELPLGGASSANCGNLEVTSTGAYSESISFYGTFDQAGNVKEFSDPDGNPYYAMGGSFSGSVVSSISFFDVIQDAGRLESKTHGFRVVALSQASPFSCRDGEDNDDDGLIDLEDPGCSDSSDSSERAEELACDDGLDNDSDGFLDFVADQDGDGISDPPGDPGCMTPASTLEDPECQDGVNNDREPGIDFDGGVSIWSVMIDDPDPECVDMPWRKLEAVPEPSSQSLGAVALALTAGLAARRRRE